MKRREFLKSTSAFFVLPLIRFRNRTKWDEFCTYCSDLDLSILERFRPVFEDLERENRVLCLAPRRCGISTFAKRYSNWKQSQDYSVQYFSNVFYFRDPNQLRGRRIDYFFIEDAAYQQNLFETEAHLDCFEGARIFAWSSWCASVRRSWFVRRFRECSRWHRRIIEVPDCDIDRYLRTC